MLQYHFWHRNQKDLFTLMGYQHTGEAFNRSDMISNVIVVATAIDSIKLKKTEDVSGIALATGTYQVYWKYIFNPKLTHGVVPETELDFWYLLGYQGNHKMLHFHYGSIPQEFVTMFDLGRADAAT